MGETLSKIHDIESGKLKYPLLKYLYGKYWEIHTPDQPSS